MDEDFCLANFSLEDIDLDFNFFDENNLSHPHDEANMNTQRAHQFSSNFDHQMHLEPPAVKKMMKINNNKPQVISFDFSANVSSPEAEDIIMDRLVGRGSKRKASSHARRSPVLAKEHVLAERKRREILTQKFIALSALLPGLKKADKVTVLDDAILRMKQLQEQIRKLNEEKEATIEMESMIYVKKSKVYFDEEPYNSSDHEKFTQALPEIEAKVVQNEVLIRIHCEKTKGCMINILNTIEKLQLRIANIIVLPFGDSTLDITVLAQMEKDFSVSVLKDLLKYLRLATV